MKQKHRPIKKEEAYEVYRSNPEMSEGKRDREGRSKATRLAEGVRASERSSQKTRATLHSHVHLVISIGSNPLKPRVRTGNSAMGSGTRVMR